MSAEDVFALAALMAGLATIAAILAGAYKRRLAFQERKLAITATQTAEKAAQYASEKATLEARVRVLESIVTDGSFDTARQIDALRDERPSDGAGPAMN
ncbi:hypothetical protein [Novosphingobium colocasiae]|uniref:hypothetical protein n=1 Tax=Novosphingobium colocasiae TaxID=1256513 RepID=UPI0035ADAC74